MAAKPKKPKLSEKELAANYGWALATLNSVPDLKKLFKLAVKKQYTPERFIAEMRNTKWFKSTSEAQRKYLVLKTADPAQYVAQMKQIMTSLADEYAGATGEVLDFTPPSLVNGKIVEGSGFLFTAAMTSLSLGYNENQIKDHLFQSIDWTQKIHASQLGGTTSGMLQQMRQQASMLGVDPSESWYGDQLGKVAMGNDTVEGATMRLKDLAKQRYTAFADRIEAGESLADISEGYKQSMSRILEVNPGSVDVFDPKIQAALTKRTDTGEDAPLSINQFEDDLRKDDRWQYTQNAKDTLMTTGSNLLKSFGLSS